MGVPHLWKTPMFVQSQASSTSSMGFSPAGEVVLLVLFAHALVQHPGVSHLKPDPRRRRRTQGSFSRTKKVSKTGLPSKPLGNMAALGT